MRIALLREGRAALRFPGQGLKGIDGPQNTKANKESRQKGDTHECVWNGGGGGGATLPAMHTMLADEDTLLHAWLWHTLEGDLLPHGGRRGNPASSFSTHIFTLTLLNLY